MQELTRLTRAIDLAEDLRSVVHTMETLAAAHARRFERAMGAADAHADTLEAGLSVLARNLDGLSIRAPEGPAWGLVVLGIDQGLCGGLNERVLDVAHRFRESDDPPTRVLVMGERTATALAHRAAPAGAVIRVPSTVDTVHRAADAILHTLLEWRADGVHRNAIVGHRATGTGYAVHSEALWPPDPEFLARRTRRPWPSRALPEVVGPPSEVLDAHVRAYRSARTHRWLVHSIAAEHQARLEAMRAAKRNIDDRVDDLRARWRQVRQDSITLELLDVVGGWQAARKGQQEPR